MELERINCLHLKLREQFYIAPSLLCGLADVEIAQVWVTREGSSWFGLIKCASAVELTGGFSRGCYSKLFSVTPCRFHVTFHHEECIHYIQADGKCSTNNFGLVHCGWDWWEPSKPSCERITYSVLQIVVWCPLGGGWGNTFISHWGMDRLKLEPDKVDDVKLVHFTKQCQMRAFLRGVGYFHRNVSKYSLTATLPMVLTKKKMTDKRVWVAKCEQAFKTLKEDSCRSVVLLQLNYNMKIVVCRYFRRGPWSSTVRWITSGERTPCFYIIRKLLPREAMNAIMENCLAIG